ncbi:hypothetical protein [Aquamicrobium sp.]|uniref:hypothetical protein n=1 Tax=Aquamicrobium sp. TaxID=1872579 RepID=UPI00258C1F85|nr:hypothetical protein [Aquamicrobium sp.]MCK9551594.1 hypothetical protein [Aquamicrobium sp.]
MKDNLYELSDGLFELRRAFVANEGASVVMSTDQVSWMGTILMHFGQMALRQAHEISRHRWNEAARADPPVIELVEEAMRPESNVVLLREMLRSHQPEMPA